MYKRIANYKWIEPLDALISIGNQTDLTMLYSAQKEAQTGDYSFLAWGLNEQIIGDNFAQIPNDPRAEDNDNLPLWFGFLGYEMRLNIEAGARGENTHIPFPNSCWNQYKHLLRFNHAARKVEYFTLPDVAPMQPDKPYKPTVTEQCQLLELYSNFTAVSYQQAISETVMAITKGDFYQANLTRKFFGKMNRKLDAVALFLALNKTSPAPYSALIKLDNAAIISASPESFLKINSAGQMQVRPIKGSARRPADPQADENAAQALSNSSKDHAENLMIVDLMRNDLAKIAEPGSVSLHEYAGLYSYSNIHHLISTITAQKRAEINLPQVLKALFPPGSMTGAPKIAAMNWCAAQERYARGVYSGALGWLGAGNCCELAVVIRTLLIRDDEFEFQAGGGIVADSEPVAEWQEMLTKTMAMAGILGIDPQLMEQF